MTDQQLITDEFNPKHVFFDPKHVFTNTWFEKWLQMRASEPERSEPTMQKADTSNTDEGTTTLESGQSIQHHRKDECDGEPCALHNPMDGPWEDWPRFYSTSIMGIYRVCPHNVAHPAVEQVIHWLKVGKEYLIPHACCTEGCMCMPRAAVPDSYFNGPRIGVRLSLYNWAGTSEFLNPSTLPAPSVPQELMEDPEKSNAQDPDDPNEWAIGSLRSLKSVVAPVLYDLLTGPMLEHHHINEVSPSGNGDFKTECSDDCNVDLSKNEDGRWQNIEEHFCPTVEIALLAGWTPVEWSVSDD